MKTIDSNLLLKKNKKERSEVPSLVSKANLRWQINGISLSLKRIPRIVDHILYIRAPIISQNTASP